MFSSRSFAEERASGCMVKRLVVPLVFNHLMKILNHSSGAIQLVLNPYLTRKLKRAEVDAVC